MRIKIAAYEAVIPLVQISKLFINTFDFKI